MDSLQIIDPPSVLDLSQEVRSELDTSFHDSIPTVEDIQDIVESTLMKNGQEQVARAYILYRAEHKNLREKSHKIMLDVGQTIDEYIGQTDWRVNANANSGYSLG